MFTNLLKDKQDNNIDDKSYKSITSAIDEKCNYYDEGMEFDSAMWLYLVTFLGTTSVIPGNVLTALFMGKFGRTNLLSGSLIIAGISSLIVFFVQENESGLLASLCFFNGITIAAWCSILVLVCEAYGTEKRTTGLAAICAISKLGAILATVIYPGLVGAGGGVALITGIIAVSAGVYAQKVKDTSDEPLY